MRVRRWSSANHSQASVVLLTSVFWPQRLQNVLSESTVILEKLEEYVTINHYRFDWLVCMLTYKIVLQATLLEDRNFLFRVAQTHIPSGCSCASKRTPRSRILSYRLSITFRRHKIRSVRMGEVAKEVPVC
jgi:hypothetical protein